MWWSANLLAYCVSFIGQSIEFRSTSTAPSPPHLAIEFNVANSLAYLKIPQPPATGMVYQLQSSTNLANWTTIGTFLKALAPYAELYSSNRTPRFYRVLQFPKTASNDWANQVLTIHPLRKFIVPLDAPDHVYFHPGEIFHYQFARRELPQFATGSPEAFDELALYPERQEVVLGGLYFSNPAGTNFGVEFVSASPFEPARLVELFKTVTSRISIPGYAPFLLPSSSQRASILSNLSYFQSQGVRVRELSEFVTNNAVHVQGWSTGTLKFVAAADLNAAIQAGTITPDTILVTDAVPRDLPPVAGFISLVPSSPNSHAVLRLQSASSPYLDLPAAHKSTLSNLLGKSVLFSTVAVPTPSWQDFNLHYPPSWYAQFHIRELALLDDKLRAALVSRKTNTVALQPIERFGAYSTNTDTLGPTHTRFFGSKAANYGILRRSLPSQSPSAIAFSFDLWLDFLEQTLGSGKTLRMEIETRLAAIATNSSLYISKLEEIRDIIEDDGQFTPSQQATITNALTVFDPTRKIRFRSSSNAEDLPSFSAAGLYESYSGCLLDDLDPGPEESCRCDPLDDKRRSVFRAIRKVFASFYTEQAFLERRRFGINESDVGMALLVHHSFPDEIELANGVATIDYYPTNHLFASNRISNLLIVSQRGAISVANPDGSDLPERVEFVEPQIVSRSTVRPPGTPVLTYPTEYTLLRDLFQQVGFAYPWGLVPGVNRLNFEFKKTPEGLSIKQVRPVYTGAERTDPVILPEKVVFRSFQGGETPAGLEDTHRLKSVWEFESGGWMPGSASTNPLFRSARVVYLRDDKIVTNTVTFETAKDSAFFSNDPYLRGIWAGATPDVRVASSVFIARDAGDIFNFDITYPGSSPASAPFFRPSDLRILLTRPGITGVSELLVNHHARMDNYAFYRDELVSRTYSTNGVSIQTRYWLTVNPSHAVVGIGPTKNLLNWEESTISGLTSEPLVLRGFFSQTYKPSRHNQSEQFLFEPVIDGGVSSAQLAELRAIDVRRIYFADNIFIWDPTKISSRVASYIELIGFDGKRRPVPARATSP
jgi:hypothetical protein